MRLEFKHFVQLIAIGLQARIPMHMTGFPGVGKTEFTKSLEAGFARAGIKCKVFILIGSIREPQDFGGFPVSTPDGVRLLPMAWARDAVRLAQDGYMVVIFLDELTTVPPTTQAAMLRLLTENVCGEISLPTTSQAKAASSTCAPAMPSNGRLVDRRFSRRWRTGCGTVSFRWTTKRGAS
jgi:MoxR-like ATPase